VADAVIRKEQAGSFTADAWFAAAGTPAGSFTADAVIKREQTQAFTVDAIVRITQSGAIVADALLRRTTVGSFDADAVIRREQTGAVTAHAVIRRERAATIAADAVIRATQQASFTIDAVIAGAAASFTIDAIIRRTQVRSFTIDAVITEVGYESEIEADVWGSAIELERPPDVLASEIATDLYSSQYEMGGTAVADVEVIEGDTGPPIIGTVKKNGVVVSLTNVASAKFQMRRVGDRRYTVDAAAEILDAPNGKLRYEWDTNDLDRPGDYEVQWELTFVGGVIITTKPPNTLTVREQ